MQNVHDSFMLFVDKVSLHGGRLVRSDQDISGFIKDFDNFKHLLFSDAVLPILEGLGNVNRTQFLMKSSIDGVSKAVMNLRDFLNNTLVHADSMLNIMQSIATRFEWYGAYQMDVQDSFRELYVGLEKILSVNIRSLRYDLERNSKAMLVLLHDISHSSKQHVLRTMEVRDAVLNLTAEFVGQKYSVDSIQNYLSSMLQVITQNLYYYGIELNTLRGIGTGFTDFRNSVTTGYMSIVKAINELGRILQTQVAISRDYSHTLERITKSFEFDVDVGVSPVRETRVRFRAELLNVLSDNLGKMHKRLAGLADGLQNFHYNYYQIHRNQTLFTQGLFDRLIRVFGDDRIKRVDCMKNFPKVFQYLHDLKIDTHHVTRFYTEMLQLFKNYDSHMVRGFEKFVHVLSHNTTAVISTVIRRLDIIFKKFVDQSSDDKVLIHDVLNKTMISISRIPRHLVVLLKNDTDFRRLLMYVERVLNSFMRSYVGFAKDLSHIKTISDTLQRKYRVDEHIAKHLSHIEFEFNQIREILTNVTGVTLDSILDSIVKRLEGIVLELVHHNATRHKRSILTPFKKLGRVISGAFSSLKHSVSSFPDAVVSFIKFLHLKLEKIFDFFSSVIRVFSKFLDLVVSILPVLIFSLIFLFPQYLIYFRDLYVAIVLSIIVSFLISVFSKIFDI